MTAITEARSTLPPWEDAATLVLFPAAADDVGGREILAEGTLLEVTAALRMRRPSERPRLGIFFPDRMIPPHQYWPVQFAELLELFSAR